MRSDPRLEPVLAHLRAAITPPGDQTDQLYRWLAYQLGWADEEGRPVEARRGKGIRPLVCLLSCQAVGGQLTAAVPAAAAIELTHEFSLVHDDIQDGDRLRRGRAAVWTVVGQAQGINVGDALFALARQQLSSSQLEPALVLEMLRRYDAACLRLAEGQYLDLAFESAAQVTLEEYVAMVRRKTGALLAASATMGALAGGADGATADAFARYGEALGVAFQMQDDVLGLWGVASDTGKPAGRDLEQRKKSLPVVLALADANIGPELASLLAQGPTPAQAAAMAHRLEQAGYRQRSRTEARRWSERALSALTGLDLASEPQQELEALARRAVERDR